MTISIHLDLTAEARNPIGSVFDKTRYISVGFGTAEIRKNGECIFDGERQENLITLEEAEKIITVFDLNADYQLIFDAPLWSAKYRRNDKGDWVCFEAGEGFA